MKDIYDESKQDYSVPKITTELRKSGEIIFTHTVGKYMKQMGIKGNILKYIPDEDRKAFIQKTGLVEQ